MKKTMTCVTSSHSSFQDIVNLFPNSKDDLVKDLKHSKVLGVPFLCLLDQCLDDVFQAKYKHSLSCCDILLDMSWEKLNSGYWKDVHLDWRLVYTVVSVIKVFCQCWILRKKQEKDDYLFADEKYSKLLSVERDNSFSLDAKDSISLVDDKDSISLVDDKDRISLVDDKDSISLVDDKDSISLVDAKDRISLVDDKNCISLVDDKDSISLVDDKDSISLVDDKDRISLVDDKDSFSLVDDKDRISLVDDKDSISLVDDKDSFSLVDDKDSISLVDVKDSFSLVDDKDSFSMDAKDSISLIDTKDSTSLADNKDLLSDADKDNSLTKNICVGDVLRSCDMGLLMGAPILDNILTKLSTKIHTVFGNSRKRTLANTGTDTDISDNKKTKNLVNCDIKHQLDTKNKQTDQSNQVEKICCPSLESFKKRFMDSNTPVIITDAMDFWPAMGKRRWTLDYLKETAGHRTVPIELGSKYTEESWSQDLLTVKDFIEKYIENPDAITTGYLAQHQLFEQVIELQNDIVIPTYCCLGEVNDVETNAWFGPKGTVSPLHYDAKQNLLAQTVGEKYIRLYSNEYAESLYPHPDHLLFNTSQVDVEMPDLTKFPLFAKVPYKECVLRTGEMLYIPPKYWHFVRSLSVSFSVSFWWK